MIEITKDTIIGDILDVAPQTAPIFLSIGMHCLGRPGRRHHYGRRPDTVIYAKRQGVRPVSFIQFHRRLCIDDDLFCAVYCGTRFSITLDPFYCQIITLPIDKGGLAAAFRMFSNQSCCQLCQTFCTSSLSSSISRSFVMLRTSSSLVMTM